MFGKYLPQGLMDIWKTAEWRFCAIFLVCPGITVCLISEDATGLTFKAMGSVQRELSKVNGAIRIVNTDSPLRDKTPNSCSTEGLTEKLAGKSWIRSGD